MRARLCLLLVAIALAGCRAEAAPTPEDKPGASFVQPVSGLGKAEMARYAAGRKHFEKIFGPPDGLGPLYNDTSCRACHGMPATGGGSRRLLTLIAGERNGAQVPLKEVGGPVIQDKHTAGMPAEGMPLAARFISQRISPPTFGLGLIEAVPSAAITARLAPSERRRALGIRGRANWEFGVIGRFGWKAAKSDMIEFTQQAAQFEMGLSSPGRPQEPLPNLPPQALKGPKNLNDPKTPWVKTFFDWRARAGKPLPQPDLTQRQVEELAGFQRYQAPPPRGPQNDETRRGERVFQALGCAECHTPAMTTGPNKIGVPAGLAVPLYSDLLIHDMGEPMSDGIIQGVAEGRDWRTAPLWGLRYRDAYLHDGRADTLQDAIHWHGHGEARQVVSRFSALSGPEQAALLAFLRSL